MSVWVLVVINFVVFGLCWLGVWFVDRGVEVEVIVVVDWEFLLIFDGYVGLVFFGGGFMLDDDYCVLWFVFEWVLVVEVVCCDFFIFGICLGG